ncbi:hypothetical protein ACHAPU_008436 [Fusarium lateritium]
MSERRQASIHRGQARHQRLKDTFFAAQSAWMASKSRLVSSQKDHDEKMSLAHAIADGYVAMPLDQCKDLAAKIEALGESLCEAQKKVRDLEARKDLALAAFEKVEYTSA